jgi:hypothetical protein
MWRRATRAGPCDLLRGLRGRQARAVVGTPTNYRGILVGRRLVRDVQAEPYSETSAL